MKFSFQLSPFICIFVFSNNVITQLYFYMLIFILIKTSLFWTISTYNQNLFIHLSVLLLAVYIDQSHESECFNWLFVWPL